MNDLTWRCDLHGIRIKGDCPRCDDELIAMAADDFVPRLFVAPDGDGNPGIWEQNGMHPSLPKCVLEEFYVKDQDLWNAIVRLVERGQV